MKMREFLENLLEKHIEKRDKLNTAMVEAEAKEERQSIQSAIAEFNQMIADVRSQLADLDKEDAGFKPSKALGSFKVGKSTGDDSQQRKSVGQSYIEDVKDKLEARQQGARFTVAAEARAATDTHVTGGPAGDLGPLLTQIDRRIVQEYRRASVADLFNWGSLTGQAITYFVEGAREGVFQAVAEGGVKPQVHYANPTSVTEAVKKIAGFIKVSDEMLQDLPFLTAEIDSRLLYDLEMIEEYQLIYGPGSGANLNGVMNRGIQVVDSASEDDDADAIYRAITAIQTATGFRADGIIINPADYEKLRLKKDGNGQYLGGGFFQGQYGQGGVQFDPPIWGTRTVVSAAVAPGVALVGNFQNSATAYRRGGVMLETTNSNDDDFIHNLVTVRAESRLALAVRRPDGFCRVNFFDTTTP